MTLLQLEYFKEVVRQKSFTKAAEILHVSQSTLSKSIRSLEENFSIEFIDRKSKEFLLTKEGVLFYEYAQSVLDFYQTKTRELYQRFREDGGILHIGIPPTAGTVLFNKVLNYFHEIAPSAELHVNDSQASKSIYDMLEAGKLDMGVLLGEFSHPNYHTYEAYRSEVMLLVSPNHRLADREKVAFSELKDEQFLMISPEYMFHDAVLECCQSAGYAPNIALYSYQWDLVYDMVAAGKGIGFLPAELLEKNKLTGVKLIRLTEPEFPWVLTVAYRKDKFLSAPMRQFLQACQKCK